jgi:hypothetical protein
MRQVLPGCLTGPGERLKRMLKKLLVAQVGDELTLRAQVTRRSVIGMISGTLALDVTSRRTFNATCNVP